MRVAKIHFLNKADKKEGFQVIKLLFYPLFFVTQLRENNPEPSRIGDRETLCKKIAIDTFILNIA